jgi:hypothetical protein
MRFSQSNDQQAESSQNVKAELIREERRGISLGVATGNYKTRKINLEVNLGKRQRKAKQGSMNGWQRLARSCLRSKV